MSFWNGHSADLSALAGMDEDQLEVLEKHVNDAYARGQADAYAKVSSWSDMTYRLGWVGIGLGAAVSAVALLVSIISSVPSEEYFKTKHAKKAEVKKNLEALKTELGEVEEKAELQKKLATAEEALEVAEKKAKDAEVGAKAKPNSKMVSASGPEDQWVLDHKAMDEKWVWTRHPSPDVTCWHTSNQAVAITHGVALGCATTCPVPVDEVASKTLLKDGSWGYEEPE